MIDAAIKYGPALIGLTVFVGGVFFFFMRLILQRLYTGMDATFARFDRLERRIQNLELIAARNADKTEIVSKLMGGGK